MKRHILIALLLCSIVLADESIKSGSITLLALVENGTQQSGGAATLSLELRSGKDRVYLETFPMTKISTQASLRFAQQVACKELDIDCSRNDFLFTIEAMPGIVGGPSAGSSATFLTSALLLNKTIPPDLAMTGTINSGGIVGPVGGLKFKLEAAAKKGMKRVYIPRGTREVKDGNKTIDLIDYGRSLNVSVKEIATIHEVWDLEFGIKQDTGNDTLTINSSYAKVMKQVATDLCDRSDEFANSAINITEGKNFTDRAKQAYDRGEFYSAASFCFRANVAYKELAEQQKNQTKAELQKRADILKSQATKVKKEVGDRKLDSLTDLQTYMAVMERVDETLHALDDIEDKLHKGKTKVGSDLVYAEERLFSGVTWSRFFDGAGEQMKIDKESLRDGCSSKISEAEERYNYVKTVLPEALDSTRADIDKSYSLLNNGDYTMCLYTASKAKAEADVLLSVIGVEEKRFGEVIDLKLKIAERALMKDQKKDVFPIIAYSYYEYAKSLRGFDNLSSLLFSGYALELANLDIYFQGRESQSKAAETVSPQGYLKIYVQEAEEFIPPSTLAFIGGLLIGAIVIGTALKLLSDSSANEIQTLQAPPKRRLRGKKR